MRPTSLTLVVNGAGHLLKTPFQPLVKRLKPEDLRQNGAKNAIVAIGIPLVSIPAAVAIFIAATEALAKVVVIVVPVYVIAVIAVVCVLISIRVSVVRTPPILTVRPSGPEAFLVTVVNGLAKKISYSS